MHRAIPTPSKLLSKRWSDREQEIHQEKLKTVKSRIASTSPVSYPHLQHRLKRQQLLEGCAYTDRFTEIERENRILLEKMSTILNAKSQEYPLPRPKSLNKIVRKRNLVQITAENQAILKRLQQRSPNYKAAQWVETQKHMDEVVRLRCEFPYQLTEPQRPKTSSRPSHRSATPVPGRTSVASRSKLQNDQVRTLATLDDKLVVFRGETPQFLVEMSTNQRLFWVVAFDKLSPDSYSAEMKLEDAVDMMGVGGYENLLAGLRVENGELVIGSSTGSHTAR